MKAGNRHNVCILGSEASGKTCFIAALATLGQVRGDRNFVIAAPEDAGTQAWLNILSRALTGGTWPPSTTATNMYEFTLEYARAPFRLTLMDYSGEAFRRGFDNLDPESLTNLQEHLFRADAVFMLLDPVADLDVAGTAAAGEELREQRLSALFNAIVKCVHMDESDGGNRALGKNVALLVTKADCIPAGVKKEGAAALIKKTAPKLYATVKDCSSMLDCFFVSAVGGDNSAAGALPAPPVPIAPEGYEDLFRWLSRCRKSAIWKRTRQRFFPWVAVASLLLAAALAGVFLLEGRRLSVLRDPSASENGKVAAATGRFLLRGGEARNVIDGLVGGRINAMRGELEPARSFAELARLRSGLEDLSRYGNNTYADEIARLFKAVDDRAEELHHDLIVSATDPEARIAAINAYRKEYPNGRFVNELADLETATLDQQDARSRQDINRIVPGQARQSWADFLLTKAAAVDGYRKERAPAHLRERMEAASRLARFIASRDNYAVTARSARTLAGPRPTLLVVSVNGREALRTESRDHTIPNWEHNAQVNWRPGDKIGIEWRYVGYWSDGAIAGLDSDSLDALRILSGTVALNPSDKKEYLDDSRAPTASFVIGDLDDALWADFDEFIFPGGYWSK
ncbi:MAG: hypothetical protein LBT97_10385 [Planctomycetota bacterium]|jgi:hypothetical protein|nr:hypothetical protein [Planctomycetota bacterium]